MHTHKRHKVLWQRRSARGYTAGRSVRVCVSGSMSAQTQTFKHICTRSSSVPSGSNRAGWANSSGWFVIFPGCLFTYPHKLRLESQCEESSCVSVYKCMHPRDFHSPTCFQWDFTFRCHKHAKECRVHGRSGFILRGLQSNTQLWQNTLTAFCQIPLSSC